MVYKLFQFDLKQEGMISRYGVYVILSGWIGIQCCGCHRTAGTELTTEQSGGGDVVVRKRENGPFIRYYHNGQVFEHSNYMEGKHHGPARKYYMNGALTASYAYDHGMVLPGLKEYLRDGTLIISYPEIRIREEDQLDTHNRIDLIISSTQKSIGVKYYLLESTESIKDRIYLISENGSASLQYYVKPGESIDREIRIAAEIPTELGNVYVRLLSYHLMASN